MVRPFRDRRFPRIQHNRVVELAQDNDRILLIPRPPQHDRGGINEYYHFVVDLLLPLSDLFARVPVQTRFVLEYFGPFVEHLLALYPDRIEIVSSRQEAGEVPCNQIVGWNPRRVNISSKQITTFREHIMDQLGLTSCNQPNKVLLIERVPANFYMLKQQPRNPGGSVRRQILNHEEVKDALASTVSSQFEFQNVILDDLSMSEQVKLFDQAAGCIGMHGAGLVNSLWMQTGTSIFELQPYDGKIRQHFSTISQKRDLHYNEYQLENEHCEVDPSHLIHWLKNCPQGNILYRQPTS